MQKPQISGTEIQQFLDVKYQQTVPQHVQSAVPQRVLKQFFQLVNLEEEEPVGFFASLCSVL